MCSTEHFFIFPGNALDFSVSDKLAFEVPLNNVSNSMTSKNEVTLEFHQNDDANVSLMELRFHIPPGQNEEVDPVEVSSDLDSMLSGVPSMTSRILVRIGSVVFYFLFS